MAERHDAEAPAGDGRFNSNAQYITRESVDTFDLESDWLDFEESLKSENRYFDRLGERLMAFLFGDIKDHRTTHGRQVIVEAGPGTEHAALYRARVFQNERALRKAMERPDTEVGPPPSPRAGRMNASGIAMFYGATDPHVALAEVWPPVGSKVLIACFDVVRPLRLLDLDALSALGDENGSRFDPSHVRRLKRAEFLRGLSRRISKPVMPDDKASVYLLTQAMADFLAARVANPPLDGIIYHSAQIGPPRSRFLILGGSGGYKRNVALFPRAARVQRLDQGMDTSVSDNSLYSRPFLDDAPDLKYSVAVSSPAPTHDGDAPLRFSTLEVHYVKSINLDTSSSSVHRRYRWEAPEPG
ncbi:MAG TPA: RES family NAD+ phosphorylase [Bryobacteraceae bacterium]